MANDVAVGLAVPAAAKCEDDRRAEEDRLHAEEGASRRNEARRPAYIENRRLKVLEVVFERVEKRERLRRIAAQITAELKDRPSPRAAKFLAWLDHLADRAERASSVEGFGILFELEHVFGLDDDESFHPSHL